MKTDKGYSNFKKYQVTDVQTVEEFLKKYTKPSRHEGRGKDYATSRIDTYTKEFNENGYCFMSHHESITGETVSFYKENRRFYNAEDTIVCDSCHADYEKSFTVDMETQGEIFCLDCYDEWLLIQEEQEEMENRIVYVGVNCGEMTKQDIIRDIDLWISEVDYFNQLNEKSMEDLKEKTYSQLLDRLEWQSPYTLLCEYDEGDIQDLLQ